MNKIAFIISPIILHLVFYSAYCQTVAAQDNITVKAKYTNGDLVKVLSMRIEYPREALVNNIQGYVVVGVTIDKSGKMKNLAVKSSPHELLSVNASGAVYTVREGWQPATVNGTAVDKDYVMVFRFRIIDYEPPDYSSQAETLKEKGKFDKAIKACDKGLKDNPYDHRLLELRSSVKELAGDTEGSKSDKIAARKIREDVMEVIYVTIRAVRRTVLVGSDVVRL